MFARSYRALDVPVIMPRLHNHICNVSVAVVIFATFNAADYLDDFLGIVNRNPILGLASFFLLWF